MHKEPAFKLTSLWWIPAVVPFLLIITALCMGGWHWGLMDDTNMVGKPGSILERTSLIFRDLLASGRFVPTASLHWGLFYKVFANSPLAFFIFRWVEIMATLGLWGLFAAHVTGKKWSAALFITIALGFYKLYDCFFYLSIPEPVGLLFAAPASIFFLNAVRPALDTGKAINWKYLILGIIFLLIAIGAKETFIVAGIALGIAALVASVKKNAGAPLIPVGGILLLLSAAYIITIKIFIIHGYSSDYSFTDAGKLLDNARLWLNADLPYHAPWIIAATILLLIPGKRAPERASTSFGLMLSIIYYLGYTAILLPWSTGGHYSVPLGVFFALTATLLITPQLEKIKPVFHIFLLIAALIFNIAVSSAALQWHHAYQTDTKNLAAWINQNIIFQHEILNGANVRINATEPGGTIPALVKSLYGTEIKPFTFTASVREILDDASTRYYLWGTSWGNQDLRRLGNMWTPVFMSDNWIMFRRMY
jgi:hypothetical protein